MGAIEYAYSVMARAAGIHMPETKLLAAQDNHLGYFGIRRFDRRGAQRIHAHTVGGLIDAEPGVTFTDYETVLQITQELTRDAQQVKQMFARAAFNIYAHNRDDHTRNHALLMDEDGAWSLAPAYDLTYSDGPGGEHSLTIAGEGAHPTAEHLRRLADKAGVRPADATRIIDQVREACGRWGDFAKDAGVSKRDWKPIRDELAVLG